MLIISVAWSFLFLANYRKQFYHGFWCRPLCIVVASITGEKRCIVEHKSFIFTTRWWSIMLLHKHQPLFNMLKFNPRYFVFAISIFVVEVLIAFYAHDEIIRPYVGDVLVVMLIYCFVKSFLNSAFVPTALVTLLFAYAIETLQYFRIVNRLGLQHSKLARTVIGTSFSWMDILAYTLGIAIIIGVEMLITAKTKAQKIELQTSKTPV